MSGRLKILVLGGYGTFGGRLVRLLADEPRLDLIVAGRSLVKARAFCDGVSATATLTPQALDRAALTSQHLQDMAPHIVIDASGPFQDYGPDAYSLVEAALAAGVHYIDLADGAAFVEGIGRFDAAAKDTGLFLLSGASTCPVLTAAVVRDLAKGLGWLHTIIAGIAPSPYAGVGLNVVRAVAAQAGRPVRLRLNANNRTAYAFTQTTRYTVAPPGRLPLFSRRFSLVEVPDLALLPPLWPQVRTVWVGAAPAPAIWHGLLRLLARGVRMKLLPSLRPLAPAMHWAANRLRWGEPRGGMFVHVTGYLRNRPAERSWHLVAEGDTGPFVPAMAAAALVRRCLEDRAPAPGARPSLHDLELADYESQFEALGIQTGRREALETDGSRPLYRRVLDEAYSLLPPSLQAMHEVERLTVVQGRAVVERGQNPLAWLAARLVGLPDASADVPVRVAFRPDKGVETWRREFDGRIFSSRQTQGKGRWQGLLVEQFGPLKAGLATVIEGQGESAVLRLVIRRWSLLGVAFPLGLGPRVQAHEHEQDGRFHFDVALSHPLTGLIVRYRGWLGPVEP